MRHTLCVLNIGKLFFQDQTIFKFSVKIYRSIAITNHQFIRISPNE